MAYYDALKTKWGTLSGTAEQKLKAINVEMVPGPAQRVAIVDVMAYLRANSLWLPIKASTDPAAIAWADLNADLRAQSVDMALPVFQGGLVELVAAKLLSQEQADHINAMKDTSVLWYESAGYSGPFNVEDIKLAGLG